MFEFNETIVRCIRVVNLESYQLVNPVWIGVGTAAVTVAIVASDTATAATAVTTATTAATAASDTATAASAAAWQNALDGDAGCLRGHGPPTH